MISSFRPLRRPETRWILWPTAGILAVLLFVAGPGYHSSRVGMDTSLYSGITLVHFPRNWRGYRILVLEVFNPSPEGLEVTCRIHDRQHEEGEQRHEDRFNKNFHLRPGWNSIRIDLGEVTRAPVGRTMDLGEIRIPPRERLRLFRRGQR